MLLCKSYWQSQTAQVSLISTEPKGVVESVLFVMLQSRQNGPRTEQDHMPLRQQDRGMGADALLAV